MLLFKDSYLFFSLNSVWDLNSVCRYTKQVVYTWFMSKKTILMNKFTSRTNTEGLIYLNS